VFEVRGLLTWGESSISPIDSNYIGNLFFGGEGTMALDGRGYRAYLGENRELADQASFFESRVADTAPHVDSFLKAVRSLKHGDLCVKESGHSSTRQAELPVPQGKQSS